MKRQQNECRWSISIYEIQPESVKEEVWTPVTKVSTTRSNCKGTRRLNPTKTNKKSENKSKIQKEPTKNNKTLQNSSIRGRRHQWGGVWSHARASGRKREVHMLAHKGHMTVQRVALESREVGEDDGEAGRGRRWWGVLAARTGGGGEDAPRAALTLEVERGNSCYYHIERFAKTMSSNHLLY